MGFRMDRRVTIAFMLVLISSLAFIVVDMNYVFFWEVPSHNFEWGVSVGDEFELYCSANGVVEYPPYNAESIALSILANTSIIVRIETLPSVDISSETDFLDFVSLNKVSTRFTNGSSIPTNISSTLNSLISKFIMPIGGWDYLDSLFPDSVQDAGQIDTYCDTYTSQRNNETFTFGYRYFIIDAGHWWYGNVSCSNGAPLVIMTASASYHPPYVSYSWTFRLDRITS